MCEENIFKSYLIKINNEDEFNKILEWKIDYLYNNFNVIDIGYSDMFFRFDSIEDLKTFESCLIMNHINDFETDIEKDNINNLLEYWSCL